MLFSELAGDVGGGAGDLARLAELHGGGGTS